MKYFTLILIVLWSAVSIFGAAKGVAGETFAGETLASEPDAVSPYDPSALYPFGRPNPAQTDPQARIFDPMIGIHQCHHERIDYETRKVTEMEARWAWYYDMNGFGIRDVSRIGRSAPASQRVYDAKTKKWHVWYFLGQGFYYAGDWVGGPDGDRLIFEKPDEIIGGRPMLSRLEYYDISDQGFKWISSNIDNETGAVFVDWRISCERVSR